MIEVKTFRELLLDYVYNLSQKCEKYEQENNITDRKEVREKKVKKILDIYKES